ncbi:PREDICTED: ceramide synthase 4 isoform X3 [Ficedula albicollis]|uniref:ceramide synthase 4 isoform X3 n=1 Tax=Ficedula albicollis TaxID=59894 RepID=UPI00035A2891|nr:PREDICTED: ceramide synthase 4 isoform X3 [Ficedula albicollis]
MLQSVLKIGTKLLHVPPPRAGGGAGVVSECPWCLQLSSFCSAHKAVPFTQDTELWHQAISHLLCIPKVVRISKDNQFRLIHGRKNVQVRQCPDTSSRSRMARSLYEWLWQHEFWLPPGITWEDMQESEDTHYPQPRHLLLSIPFALILVVIRRAFERAIALPLSTKLGVRDKQRPKAQPNPLLETFYSTRRKNPEEGELLSLAKQCDLPVRKVEKWFRRRRNMDRPSLSKKFSEACWRFTFYIISFFTGIAVLYDKPWLWDHRECWTGYPQQPLQPSLFWYYMLELSFYWSLVFTLPFDVKRKDFKEQIVHHAATIFLISFSYCANYIRIGTLVLVIHDASDCFLELFS